MRIRYYCHFGHLTGYARAAHDYLKALDECAEGCTLEIYPLGEGAGTDLEPRYHDISRFVTTERTSLPDVAIYHSAPSQLARLAEADEFAEPREARVAVTTWETDAFPSRFLDPIASAFHLLLVPSEFCADAFVPFTVQVRVVPHCFEPEFWQPSGEPHEGPYRFYSLGAWCARKNPEGLLRAYLHEFDANDDVVLTYFGAGVDVSAARSLIARTGIPMEELPELYIPNTPLTEQELLEAHDGGDCFVSATRGEGFGLPHFEAAIMGNRVITPMETGVDDFLAAYPLTYGVGQSYTPCFGEEVRGPVLRQGGQLVQQSTISMPPGVTCKQTWGEPNLAELGIRMREAWQDHQREGHCDMTVARNALEDRFGYKPVAQLLVDTLKGDR